MITRDKERKFSQEFLFKLEILKISLRSYLIRKRLIFTEVFLLLPIAVPLYYIFKRSLNRVNIWNVAEKDAVTFFVNNIYGIYLWILIPLTLSIFAAYAISDEFNNKTMFYLLNRPINCIWIVLYKYLSLVPISVLITFPPILVNMLLYGIVDPQTNWKQTLEWTWNLSVGAFLYSLIIIAVVMVFSFLTKKAIILSLVYSLGYEMFGYRITAGFFDNLRFGFGSYYVQCYLVHTIKKYSTSPIDDIYKFLQPWSAILMLILIIGFLLTVAYLILESKEYK